MDHDRGGAAHLDLRMLAIASAVTERQYGRMTELQSRYGAAGRVHCHADALFHLRFLAQAVRLSAAQLFVDYIGWVKIMLASRGVASADLKTNLEILAECATEGAEDDAAVEINGVILEALARYESLPETLTLLLDGVESDGVAARYLRAVLRGDRRGAVGLILSALDDGMPLPAIYVDILERAQIEIGRMWQANRISVAQEHFGTAATQLVMSQLFARIMQQEPGARRIVTACVGDELHEVGLRIVTDLLELSGWATHYLGANVPATAIVEATWRNRADVLALSTTLTPHVGETERVIAAVRAHPETRHVAVLVGGAPFQIEASLWEKVGANGSARNAREAVDLAGRFAA